MNYYRRRTQFQESKNWFEKNQGIWTFGATIISGIALIISICVMLDQKETSRENLDLAKKQIDLAKAQFDSSNSERQQASKDMLEKFKYQDSIYRIQLSLSMSHLKTQQYANEAEVERDRPEINIDSMWFSENSLYLYFSNIGTRPLDFNYATIAAINYRYRYIYTDTITGNLNLARNQSTGLYFEKEIPDSILKNYKNTVFYLEILTEDLIIHKKRLFKLGFSASEKLEDNVNMVYDRFNTKNEIDLIEQLIQTKNWNSFFRKLK